VSALVEEVVTQEGDTVDLIAFTRFGAHGMEPAIFDANPGLAALGPVLPAGIVVRVPVPVVKDRASSSRLWG